MPDERENAARTERQQELYRRDEQELAVPIAFDDLKSAAKEALGDEEYNYIAGGAGSEDTLRSNREAFFRWQIVPKMLQDTADIDTGVDLFGNRHETPFLLSPIGLQALAHDQAEVGSAKGAASEGIPTVLSNTATSSIEEIAEAVGDTPRWFQLYWPKDDELTKSFLERAERAGYDAIVVTVDSKRHGWRERELRDAYLPPFHTLSTYFEDPVFLDSLDESPEENVEEAIAHYNSIYADHSHNWEDLPFLQDNTDLPILLKGILHPEDAARALEYDVDGIVVSNHGARQIDGAVGSLDALRLVTDEIDAEIPVLFDSGIRRGEDALKAMALGADAVFVGRPYVFGLAIAGERGVREVLKNIRAQYEMALALSGHTTPAELERDDLYNLTTETLAGTWERG